MQEMINKAKVLDLISKLPIEDADSKNPNGTVSLKLVFNVIENMPITIIED